ncbi:putative inorganic polyphosphate/ATP-NAD kinase [Symmachiella macrocystis]|uniref:NAD kinase n=1 Tax=Symmachiella macrocystis TaxID=2527985 RepID=A0A5C6BS56_9PLAN|nr:NAD(+)/NADH kinase [Symmachiella macrocystis]TWU14597.1 putative inorganic polyphosphate/ATP-NAD kinase [Symmachiella macrocystis]
MSPPPLKLIIIARDQAPHVQAAWDALRPVLEAQVGIEIVGVEYGETDFKDCPADIAVVLGGDGSILRACRQMGMHQIPILGINLGRLGFLADVSPKEFCQDIPKLLAREYTVVDYLMYQCRLIRQGGEERVHLGLNEVAISAGASFSMIDVHLEIDGDPVTTYSGDGLIISTPVGSTAHNLSAGGPILRQDLPAFVITPICPHTLTVRPLVDRADCVYALTVPKCAEGVTLVIDGQIHEPLTAADRIEVTRASVSMHMLKLPGHSYYRTLHRKLGWAGQPRYQQH